MNLKIFSDFYKLQSTLLKLKFCHLIQEDPLKYSSVFHGLYQLPHVIHKVSANDATTTNYDY